MVRGVTLARFFKSDKLWKLFRITDRDKLKKTEEICSILELVKKHLIGSQLTRSGNILNPT